MDGLRSVSFRDLDPSLRREIRTTLAQIDPENAADLYAQLRNHPDLFERIARAGESPPGQNGAAQGEDLEQLLVEYALRTSGDPSQPRPNDLGAMTAPAGSAAGATTGGLETAKKLAAEGRSYGNVDAYGYVDPESGDPMNCSQYVLSCHPELARQGIVGAPDMQQAAAGGMIPPQPGDVITSAAGSAYGHVGIMGDDGMVYHSVPGRGPIATPYQEWIETFPPNGSISMS
jgi:hypothetical protein